MSDCYCHELVGLTKCSICIDKDKINELELKLDSIEKELKSEQEKNEQIRMQLKMQLKRAIIGLRHCKNALYNSFEPNNQSVTYKNIEWLIGSLSTHIQNGADNKE